ncbi:TRAP transporter small permease [Pikeienuella piscinae]|uniref:TRAP transporter small permease protein n=2 Tax=Pikeienuella piscinae TaxID=2748098 RepID=A0A7M3T704_9RHOB|nr:TRAP transporter small permease [Pikeienuella piscinae]
MNVVSVVGAAIWVPFPGDFEMTEVGVAVAAFAFLPYCQLTDSNVTADIFTAGASRRWIARFRLLASVVALLFGALLLWRMFAGMESQREYGYTTTILQLPIWLAFIPILISLALLVAAALISINDAGRAARADG